MTTAVNANWRLSSGTAAVLGLLEIRMQVAPTTAYIMLGERCLRNCAYCAQAHGSTASEAFLSRVTWPLFSVQAIARALADAAQTKAIRRVCLQVTRSRESFTRTLEAVRLLRTYTFLPICCSTVLEDMREIAILLEAGADRVTLALDAACERVYRQLRGNDWPQLNERLERAAREYPGHISTHLIVGLGETEQEFVWQLQRLYELGVCAGLFAFTPLPGTKLAFRQAPALPSYRRMQSARYLIYELGISTRQFTFHDDGTLSGFGLSRQELDSLFCDGSAFRTSGCSDCNRPYYNERPAGILYNYPRALTSDEARREVDLLLASLEL